MTPRTSVRSEQQRQQALVSRLNSLSVRLEAVEHSQYLLENTVGALAREAGIAVGSPCTRCDRSHVLMKDGLMYCPKCGHRHTL